MAIGVVIIYIIIIVLPILSSSIIGRVDVDAIDLAFVEVEEQLEGVIVLAFDHHVMGRVWTAAFHGTEMLEGWIDRFAETRDRSQFRDVNSFSIFTII